MKIGIKKLLAIPALLLLAVYALSFLAEHHWSLEVLRSFLRQYIFMAAILAALYAALRHWQQAALMLLLIGGLCIDMWAPSTTPVSSSPTVSLAQFNKHGRNRDLHPLQTWLQTQPAEIVIVQEVLRSDVDILRTDVSLKETYPHRFPTQRQKNLDIYVMSRHPLSGEVLTLSTPFGTSKALRATINVPQMTAPLVLYSIHTARPLPAVEAHMRNAQLQAMAAIIAADPSPFIILGGDLNITPWSPAFKNLLRGANMHYQTGGWLRHATWPSYLQVPLVQIPIDHLLPNNNLALATAQSGPYLKSDHRPYLATFTEK